MLITDEYRKQQQEFHAERSDYGTSGHKWAKQVARLSEQAKTRSILDYGAGKQTLQKSLPFPITNYDPCTKGYDTYPEPHDIVVCTDVLEHIEPECIDDVLNHLKSVTKLCLFCTVSTVPANKFLQDGRNAHLIQEKAAWWMPKFLERFDLQSFQNFGHEFAIVCTPVEDQC